MVVVVAVLVVPAAGALILSHATGTLSSPQAGTGSRTGAIARSALGPIVPDNGLPAEASWANITPSTSNTSPSPRAFAAMAYDPQFDGVILFGGDDSPFGAPGQGALGDTWLYANGSWTNLTARLPAGPSPRWAASFTWDPLDQYLVLFGGRIRGTGGPHFANDTWTLNRSGWHHIHPSTAPSPRGLALMTYDPDLSAVLLSGGGPFSILNGSISPRHDTWSYASGVWKNITARAGEVPNEASAMVYDPGAGGVIATGFTVSGTLCTQPGDEGTWLFANGTWSQIRGASTPLSMGRMVYDSSLGTALYVGGCRYLYTDMRPVTYEWANGTWDDVTDQLPTHQIAALGSSLAYDASTGLDVLFGGKTFSLWSRTPGFENFSFAFPYAPLSLSVNANRAAGYAPVSVDFAAYPSGGPTPLSYSWNFGDGSPNATSQFVGHTFQYPGIYDVWCTVTNAVGYWVHAMVTVKVHQTLGVTAALGPEAGEAPFVVAFHAAATGGLPPYQFDWVFSDGSSATSPNGTHQYAAGGTYTPELTVTDAAGNTASYATTVALADAVGLTVNATATTGAAPFTVGFAAVALAGQSPFAFAWSFGDGDSATGTSVNHTYTTPGSFEAVAMVTDGYNHSVGAAVNLTVVPALTAQVTGTPAIGVAPLPVEFKGVVRGGLAPLSYRWSFGDGSSATNLTESHDFEAWGTYAATLSVTDALGDVATNTTRVQVVRPLQVAFAAPPSSARLGSPISLNASAMFGEGPYMFSWEGLPPGCPSTSAASLFCVPSNAGTFPVTVRVTDGLGEVANATATVVVLPSIGPGGTSSLSSLVPFYLAAVVVLVVVIAVLAFYLWKGPGGPPADGSARPGRRG